jgi:hypothetical protein
MSVLALASCGSDGNAQHAKSEAPIPPITEMDAAMAQPAPQPLAASDTLTPILPAAGTPQTTTTVTTAAPALVAATAPVGVSNVEERIARLEQTVGSLRADYDRIMPAFASLNTTNERIQTLLDEIEKDSGHKVGAATVPADNAPATKTEVTTTTAPTAPASFKATQNAMAPAATIKTDTVKPTTVKEEAAEPATPAAAAAPEASASGANVTGVRIGEHGTKTRFVLDLSTKTKPEFKYDLDNAEKLLLVDLPSTGWTGNDSGKGGAAAPIVAGWSVQKGAGGGSTLAIQLKKNARILSTQFLPADGKDPARLVMDIAAGN